MNIKILYSFLFFITMGGYALLRELRDGIFIYLVGINYLPQVKIYSLLFLFVESKINKKHRT
jgi:hypothetical protein